MDTLFLHLFIENEHKKTLSQLYTHGEEKDLLKLLITNF